MKAEDFDRRFDDGEDISEYLDMERARRPEQEQKRVNIDLPLWMIRLLDKDAKRLGVPRQAIIKVWVAERLKRPVERHDVLSRYKVTEQNLSLARS